MSAAEATGSLLSTTQRDETASIEEALLAKVLEPYSEKGCRYLVSGSYKATPDSLVGFGDFSITDSAYIRSTGHFNAVELLLCFNQLAYSAFAPAVGNNEIAPLRGWSMADFYANQLPGMLIKRNSSRFGRPINAHRFSARLVCEDFEIRQRTWRYLLVPCAIEFWDDDGGAASGEIELAVLNIP